MLGFLQHPETLPHVFRHLWFFAVYMFAEALTIPLASTVYIAWMGTQHAPIAVAAIGAGMTAAGSAAQYLAVRWVLVHAKWLPRPVMRLRVRIEEIVQKEGAATFWALFIVYATPLGAGVLRLAAAAGKFPLGKFVLAIALGCLPYHYALAALGRAIRPPLWAYGALFVVLTLLGLWEYFRRRRRAARRRAQG